MAPGSNNNNNNNIRQTGTKPKTKSSRKNSVPQEIVAPTRRDLQQQLNVLVDWATVSTNSNQQNLLLKPRNNRTPGEGTCYEIDNLTLQENSRYIPVRPIVRRNLLNEGSDTNDTHNTAVGVVIPTTPNSAAQTFRLNDNSQKHILNPTNFNNIQPPPLPQNQQRNFRSASSPLSSRVPDGASQNQLNLNKNSNQQTNLIKANVEDKLNQIQEYIKLTTSLISSVQNDNLNGPRPHSVQSINTNHSITPVQTPSYDDTRVKVETQNKSMQNLKDQQQQLLRLQQSARQQLAEMEQIRNQATSLQINNFDSVEQVQDNIGGLMERMRVLSTFIQNQNELGHLLGDENDDVLAEQFLLQNKFQELRNKKTQMQDLVSELQSLNVEANRSFQEADTTTSSSTNTRIVPMDIERNVPIELTNTPASAAASAGATRTFGNNNGVEHIHLNGLASASPIKVDNETDTEEACVEEDQTVIAETADLLNDKINEINAMKSQLRRLKEMMDTVKLIEMKTGESVEDDLDGEVDEHDENNLDSGENTRSPSVISQLSDMQHHEAEETIVEPQREQLSQRVEVLHAMTRDLREQAKSIAAERDRLKTARNDLQQRRNNVSELQQQAASVSTEKLTNHVASFVSSLPPQSGGPKEREQIIMKAELEAKRKELENIEKMTETIKKNTDQSRRNTATKQKLSSVSSLDSLRSQSQQPPVIPPPPMTSAANNNTGNSKNSGDSGVTDIFANVNMESGSYQSSSTRSLNMVPPMPDICNRNDRYRKSHVDHQEPSMNVGTSTSRDRSSPWPHLYAGGGTGAGPSSSNTGPQSPHFHPYTGSEIHNSYPYNYPAYSNLIPPHTPNSADPLVFQHFMQTQQMLMNSITQCNQLLWIQQREINNLNNAVLLLQERILNTGSNSILMTEAHSNVHLRAESTPPNNNNNSSSNANAHSIYSRARSEQPSNLSLNQQTSPYHPLIANNNPNFNPPSATQFPISFNPAGSSSSSSQFNVNQQIQRNNSNITGSSHRNYRNLRHVNINTNTTSNNNALYDQQQSYYEQQQQQIHTNNFMNQQQNENLNDSNIHYNNNTNTNNLINNLSAQSQQQQQQPQPQQQQQQQSLQQQPPPPPPSHQQQQHNLNNLNNNLNNTNSSNLHQNNLNLYSQSQQQQQQQQQQQNQTQALNNQVLPGNRANNYWDNFRSYSRQNLLSSSSCKSNEESCAYTANNINNPIQRNNSNINNYNNNILDNNTTNQKYQPNFNRNNSLNNVNQLNAATSSSIGDLAQNQQHHQQSQLHEQIQMQPQAQQQLLNQSSSFDLGELQFHTNPINLGLANKAHPKGTGNKKYPISLRYRDCNNADGCNLYNGTNMTADSNSDLNLASASNYQHDTKSTSKLFEALKENVYQEVKNLITANESRPHFLIQLFRELQLISSDPLRQRTLQSIQDLYNRYIETTIHEENHVNNIGSNNLLTSNAAGNGNSASNLMQNESGNLMNTSMSLPQQQIYNMNNNNIRQQQQTQTDLSNYEFPPLAQSTPTVTNNNTNNNQKNQSDLIHIPNSEIINIIMNDIVNVINSVDYINDSVLCKIIDLICNHTSNVVNNTNSNKNGNNVINKDEFLRHLNSWNRTDKDEFISNLENYLNNILLCSSSSGESTLSITSTIIAMPQQQELAPFNNNNNNISEASAVYPPIPDQSTTSASTAAATTTLSDIINEANNNANSTPASLAYPLEYSIISDAGVVVISNSGSNSTTNSVNYSNTTYDLAEADQTCDMNVSYPRDIIHSYSQDSYNGAVQMVPMQDSTGSDMVLSNNESITVSEDDLNFFK